MHKYSTQQIKVLRQLGPAYLQAIRNCTVQKFYDEAYELWFQHWLEPRFNRDLEEYDWAVQLKRHVSLTTLYFTLTTALSSVQEVRCGLRFIVWQFIDAPQKRPKIVRPT